MTDEDAVRTGQHTLWRRLRQLLWQPPRAHGEQPRERVVGPLELFYDLVVVVLVAQAARHLAGQLTWRGLGEYAAVFALVWIAWVNGSLHHELHGHEDARARNVFLLQILVLVPLGATIPQAGGGRGAAFAITAGILFAVLAALWFLASRGDQPEYRRASRRFVAGTAFCAIILGATAFLPSGPRVLAWGLLDVAYLVGFGAVIVTADRATSPPLIITPALIERFGLLIIIVLGEIVTGIVNGLAAEPTNALTLVVALIAVVIGFGAWWTYFDFAGHRDPRPTPAATAQWMLAHLPLTAAVAAMGAAMVSLIEHAHAHRTPTATSWVLCGAAAVTLCATMLVAASLRAWRSERGLYRPLAGSCVAVAILCLGLGALHPAPVVLGLILVVLFTIPWVLAVTYRVRHQETYPEQPVPQWRTVVDLRRSIPLPERVDPIKVAVPIWVNSIVADRDFGG
jgi:low temperature requirement protein LtrA